MPAAAPITTSTSTAQRLTSLDQFRGYTVLGMFVVNFLGSFDATPGILKHHHDYCSYADTIMPQFLFAVGFAFRLTFERRAQRHGALAAYSHVVQRVLGLMLLSVVIYTTDWPPGTWEELKKLGPSSVLGRVLKRDWFQTLMHIAVTSLWILPVIRSRPAVRISFGIASAILHVALSWWFNFEWCNTSPNVIDGGPLGFLTWTIPAVAGTLACDLVLSHDPGKKWLGLICGAVGLMAVGWLASWGTRCYDVSANQARELQTQRLAAHPVVPLPEQRVFRGPAEPPFVPPPAAGARKWNYWMMSQRAGTLTYLTFTAGFSLAVFSVFHLLCDRKHRGWSVFRVFGSNALAGYVFHLLVMNAVDPFVPRDAPGWYVTVGLCVFLAINWILIRHLEKNNIYFRL